MTTKTLTKSITQNFDHVENDLKYYSESENISIDVLRKTFKFLKDVKKQVTDNPVVALNAIAAKHGVNNNYTAVLIDLDYIEYGEVGKPKGYKKWIAAEPSVKQAAEIIKQKKSYISANVPKSDKRKMKRYSRLDPIIQVKLNKIETKHSDKEKLTFLWLQRIREMILEDPTQSLSEIWRDYGLHSVYLARAKDLHILAMERYALPGKRGGAIRYQWTTTTPTLEMAVMLEKAVKQFIKKSQKANRDKKKAQQEKVTAQAQVQEEQLQAKKAKAQSIPDVVKQPEVKETPQPKKEVETAPVQQAPEVKPVEVQEVKPIEQEQVQQPVTQEAKTPQVEQIVKEEKPIFEKQVESVKSNLVPAPEKLETTVESVYTLLGFLRFRKKVTTTTINSTYGNSTNDPGAK